MECWRIVNGIKNKNTKNSLGAMWNASHLAVRLCALRHWKRVSKALKHLSIAAKHAKGMSLRYDSIFIRTFG